MGFEVFNKGSAPMSTVPSVTIQKRGNFSMNSAASELLGHPDAVQFLWDAENRLIALKPVPLDAPNAYPAREQTPANQRSSGRRGVVLIAGTMFTRYIELDTSVARRWVPKRVDGLLIVDLKEEGQLVVANRNRRAREASAEDANAAP